MKDEEKPESNEPKQTEEERIQQVLERIRNSKTFINKTQPGKGTAIIGGVRQSWGKKAERNGVMQEVGRKSEWLTGAAMDQDCSSSSFLTSA